MSKRWTTILFWSLVLVVVAVIYVFERQLE
jgi:hypothetical protein